MVSRLFKLREYKPRAAVDLDELARRRELHDAHNLMPRDIAARIPALYGGGDAPTAHVKWFTPWGAWTWYVTEHNPADGLCFGLVDGQVEELGYFSLEELRGIRGPGGLRIERDLHWAPRPLADCRRRSEGAL